MATSSAEHGHLHALPGATFLQRLAVIAAPVACAVLYLFNPSTTDLYPICPFRAMTGLWCPGCGTLRATNRLLHGQFGEAVRFNPLAIALAPILLYAFVSSVLAVVRGRGLPRVVVPASWIWGLGVVVVLFGIARNVPVYPLTLLKP